MKHSLKRQMAVVFIGLLVFVLIFLFAVNSRFLEQYYIVNKQADLTGTYLSIDKALQNDSIGSSAVQSKLNIMTEKGNISAVVADSGLNVVFMTMREDNGKLQTQLTGYLLGKNQEVGKLLKSTELYEIRRTMDPANNTEYIEMWGFFSDGSVFIMRSPLESIRESASLANKFLVYMGVFAVLLSILLVWYFAKRITDPILELAELSKRMAGLDFEAKYTRGGKDEIGILGASFNTMSSTLENTISELKGANNRLQKDIERKEEIETMRSEFIGNVSHELKTPIALIQGYAEGLKEGVNEDAESRDFYCDVIVDEAVRMNEMVKNLLTLNQLEFGDEELSFEWIDIMALTRGVLQSCEILIQQAGAEAFLVENGAIYVWADEFKTEQVIRNYLTNAIHHAANEKRIELKIEELEDTVRIKVFNSGNPIPEEDVDKIWDKFYKVDKAHTRAYGGNGIGLSIVKAIMESFHQKYGVTNYDNGVEFWLELDRK